MGKKEAKRAKSKGSTQIFNFGAKPHHYYFIVLEIRSRLHANGLLNSTDAGNYMMHGRNRSFFKNDYKCSDNIIFIICTKTNMSQPKEAFINNILTEVAHLLSDMGTLRFLPEGSICKEGFTDFSKIFCDSIIFWGLYNGEKEKTKGTVIGKHIAELRQVFEEASLEVESIKVTNPGVLADDDCTVSKKVRRRHRKECKGKYLARYIGIKVSLNYCKLQRTVLTLDNILKQLAKKCIVLHDIDFAQDCGQMTKRQHLEKHIRELDEGKIVNDRKKVGDNCVSWIGNKEDTKNIRFKVYNKFVQQLESAEVRKSLGSRMENLVEKEGKFAQHLERYKDCGYSRMELTFYGSKLLSTSEYRNKMKETREMLDSCTTFKCSHENQWTQRAKVIESMVAVYFPRLELFAYCHWWNSITSKKCGYMWKKVSRKMVPGLLANFSFNDRPIYYLEAKVKDDVAVITKEITYQRVPGSTEITLVAGGHKGMFPSRKSLKYNVNKFSDVGIVEVDNISIAWPKKRIDKRTPPIADITEYNGPDDRFVGRLKSIHSSSYRPIYSTLKPGSTYTVTSAGVTSFRGKRVWHFITECGLKVREGESFRKIWSTWRTKYLGEYTRRENVDGVEYMTFVAKRKVRVRGKDDMLCEIVE